MDCFVARFLAMTPRRRFASSPVRGGEEMSIRHYRFSYFRTNGGARRSGSSRAGTVTRSTPDGCVGGNTGAIAGQKSADRDIPREDNRRGFWVP